MNDKEQKLLFATGILMVIASSFKSQFTPDQLELFNKIAATVDSIVYPQKDLSLPNPRERL